MMMAVSMSAMSKMASRLAHKLSTKAEGKQKVVCALYEGGHAGKRNNKILGAVENALGLTDFLKARGHEFVVTSDKDGPNSVLERHLHDATVIISQPFWPAYVTAERIAKAPQLKLAITAGVGSDHVDLAAAAKRQMTVAEVTGSNVVSVAEHVVMMILSLVRNYIPGHQQVVQGQWDIAAVAENAYDLEGKHVGAVGAGRIGYRVLQRLHAFDCHLHYYDKIRLPIEVEKDLNVTYHTSVESLAKACDVVTINTPLHPETENLFNTELLSKMKRGSYIVNTARGKIVNTDALVQAVKSNHIAGYAGDVWFPQPAPADHPWRTMPRQAMTVHYSGTTIDAQARYAAGVKEILENYFDGKPQRREYLILEDGKLISPAYTLGDMTRGAR